MCPRSEAPTVGFREISLAPVQSTDGPRPLRGARLPNLLGLQTDPDEIFSELKVALVGIGSVGRHLAFHLSRLMIHTIWLVDPGYFKPESILTQAILPTEVGRPKATSTAEICKKISPDTRVFACENRLEELDLLALADSDLVLLATDNLVAEVEAGQRCLHLGKSLFHISVHGSTLVAQTRFFANRDANGPCPVCGFGEEEWNHLNRQTRFSCEGVRNRHAVPETHGPVTASFSFLCSLAADLALVQVARFVLNLGEPITDSLTEFCGFTGRSVASSLQRNPHCRCEHVAWSHATPPRPLGDCSLRELSGATGHDCRSQLGGISVSVDDWEYVQACHCPGCGRRQPVQRFLNRSRPPVSCHVCDQPLAPLPFFTHRRVPLDMLGSQVDRPLRCLTPGTPRWVVIHDGDRGVCFRHQSGHRGQRRHP